MTKLRVAIATVPFAIGLTALVIELTRGHWLSGSTSLLLGCVVAWAIVLGLVDSKDSTFLRIAAPMAMLLGIFAVFAENRAFDLNVAKAHIDALHAFSRLQEYCRPIGEKLQGLQSEGIKACATQDNSDEVDALVDLQKAKEFPPALALADGARSALSHPQADRCLDAFESAKALCPEISLAVRAVGSNVPH